MLCNHDETHDETPVEVLSIPGKHEVYMCECGVMFDINAERNFSGALSAMTSTELTTIITEIKQDLKSELIDTIAVAIREV